MPVGVLQPVGESTTGAVVGPVLASVQVQQPQQLQHQTAAAAAAAAATVQQHQQQLGTISPTKKLDNQKVHVTETASEASLHAIAEAVAEFAIGD